MFYLAAIFKIIFLFMHMLPRMNVILDFIWTLQFQLQGTWNKWAFQKILFIVRFEPSHDKETSLQVRRLNHSANSRLLWMKKIKCLSNAC